MNLVLALCLWAGLAQDEVPLEPGVSVRVYNVGEGMDRLLPLVPGQTPNTAVVLPVLDLETERAPAPGGLEELFLLDAFGVLRIPESGTYGLRLVSDDGSQLWLGGQLRIDHDRLHAPSAAATELELEAGDHPFHIRFFQNYGGFQLSFEWQPPGSDSFEVVPAEALLHSLFGYSGRLHLKRYLFLSNSYIDKPPHDFHEQIQFDNPLLSV